VVTELAIAGDGVALDAASVAPQRLPALFVGAPVVVAARLRGKAGGAVVVTGKTPSGQPWSQRIPVVSEARGEAAAAIWARARIRDLEDLYAVRGGGAELEREIVAVSVKHRVLSRFTAFLAVDRSEKVNPNGKPKTITQAVEMPAGWEMAERAAAPRGRMMKTMAFAGAPGGGYVGAAPPPMSASAQFPGAPPPAPGPMQPKRAGGGLIQKAKAIFAREEFKQLEAEAEELSAVDLMPYRKRAKELADAIEKAGEKGDASGLDLALARLVELVEDLRSVGGADAMAEAVDRVAATLRGGDWRAAAEELREVADGTAGGRGRAFWK
jgi:Ca-activated chloride channel family protein